MTLREIDVVGGAIAGTEGTHRTAFDQAFAEAGQDLFWAPDIFPGLPNAMGGHERVSSYPISVRVTMPSQAIARAL